MQEDTDLVWLLKTYQPFFERFGMERENILSVYNEWNSDENDTPLKYLWAIFEKLLYETYQQVNEPLAKFRILSLILNEMRNYKISFEGDVANDIYKKYLFCQLKLVQLQNNPSIHVTIVAVHCCPYCNALHGTQLPVQEALLLQLLPPDKCTSEAGCNCFYKPEITNYYK